MDDLSVVRQPTPVLSASRCSSLRPVQKVGRVPQKVSQVAGTPPAVGCQSGGAHPTASLVIPRSALRPHCLQEPVRPAASDSDAVFSERILI